MMSSADKELEEQLLEAGNKLLDPPESVDELLSLLDQVEKCLLVVEQSPSKSIQDALSPSLKALVGDQLLKHSDADVKVSVASCITEITRITAPEAPYEDDMMREVFKLIVSSFENLSDNNSRSYDKRTQILDTVAKVRSCVVMLDLECDALILEMFQHLLKAVRDHHPDNVLSSMETIMTLVLEESEEIPQELLLPLLASVKKDNQEVLPIAQKLAERVLEHSASKIKPYLVQAVKSLGISLDEYSEVVASLCQETPGDSEQNEVNAAYEQLVVQEKGTEVVSPEKVNSAGEGSPKSHERNGVTGTGDVDLLLNSTSLKNQDQGDKNVSKTVSALGKTETESRHTDKDGKGLESSVKSQQATKKQGRKPNTSLKMAEISDGSHKDDEKNVEKESDHDKNQSTEVSGSPRGNLPTEAAVPSEKEKESGVQISPNEQETEGKNIQPSAMRENSYDENRPKKAGRGKKKDGPKEATASTDKSKRASESTSDIEVRSHRRSGKRVPAKVSDEEMGPETIGISKDNGKGNAEVKTKESAKKADVTDSSAKEDKEERKKRRGKGIAEKDRTHSAAKDDKKSSVKDKQKEAVSLQKSFKKSIKDEAQLEETPRTNSKRKRTTVGEKASDIKEYGENLVGSKVKVWWPKDKAFYKGVVDKFDPVKKKHRVSYDDGDEEILNLKREKWEFVPSDSELEGEDAAVISSPDASSRMPQKKKGKSNTGTGSKRAKVDASAKKVGGSSKSKGAAAKSGTKTREMGNVDGKVKDKFHDRSEDDDSVRTKERKGGNKAVNDASKATSKSKDGGTDTSKVSKSKDFDSNTPKGSKSKQETLKSAAKSSQEQTSSRPKGKRSKTGTKFDVNGSKKGKSGSSKMKDREKEDLPDSAIAPDAVQVKSQESSKAKESEPKSGKKRRRGNN